MDTHLEITHKRLGNALNNPDLRQKGFDDFLYTFKQLGVSEEKACTMAANICFTQKFKNATDLLDFEKGIYDWEILQTKVAKEKLLDVLTEKLKGRAEKIFNQVERYFNDISVMMDYGTGDAKVLKLLHQKYNFSQAIAYDVVDYLDPDVAELSISKMILDDGHIPFKPGYVEAILLTNVMHHEIDNQKIIDQATSLASKRIVVIETVPVGDSKEALVVDAERTFLNDWLYNRIFHFGANVPVPGTYDTPQGWIERFTEKGWNAIHSEDLGVDQPVIRDTHHLLVFEK